MKSVSPPASTALLMLLVAVPHVAAAQNYSANCPLHPAQHTTPDGEYTGELFGVLTGRKGMPALSALQTTRGMLTVNVRGGQITSVEGNIDVRFVLSGSDANSASGVSARVSGDVDLVSGSATELTMTAHMTGDLTAFAFGSNGDGSAQAHDTRGVPRQDTEYKLRVVDQTCRSLRLQMVRGGVDEQAARALRAQGFTMSFSPATLELHPTDGDRLAEAESALRAQLQTGGAGVVQRRSVVMRRWKTVLQDLERRGHLDDVQKQCLRQTFMDEVLAKATEWLHADLPSLNDTARNLHDVAHFNEIAGGLIDIGRGIAELCLESCASGFTEEVFADVARAASALATAAIDNDQAADALRFLRTAALLGGVSIGSGHRTFDAVCDLVGRTARSAYDSLMFERNAHHTGTPYYRQLLRRAAAADREADLVCGTQGNTRFMGFCNANPADCR